MTTKDTGGSAFPNPSLADESYRAQPGDMGMTLRDWFAGQALSAMPEPTRYVGPEQTKLSLAKHARNAYQIADAMIAARGADQ